MKSLLLTLLLLCGAAQACERDGNIHPDSVCVHGTDFEGKYGSAVIHRRWVSDSLTWCVGRVDTLVNCPHPPKTCFFCLETGGLVTDTTWVRCCDSAARGLVEDVDWGRNSPHKTKPKNLLDSLCDLQERYSLETARHIFKCGNDPCPYDVVDIEKDTTFVRYKCGGVDTLTWRPKVIEGSDTIIYFSSMPRTWTVPFSGREFVDSGDVIQEIKSFPIIQRFRGINGNYHIIKEPAQIIKGPDWRRNPECWYIESVDRTWVCSEPYNHYCWGRLGCPLRIVTYDTTWAEKIPLAEKHVTPEEWDMLMRLVNGFYVNNKWRLGKKTK